MVGPLIYTNTAFACSNGMANIYNLAESTVHRLKNWHRCFFCSVVRLCSGRSTVPYITIIFRIGRDLIWWNQGLSRHPFHQHYPYVFECTYWCKSWWNRRSIDEELRLVLLFTFGDVIVKRQLHHTSLSIPNWQGYNLMESRVESPPVPPALPVCVRMGRLVYKTWIKSSYEWLIVLQFFEFARMTRHIYSTCRRVYGMGTKPIWDDDILCVRVYHIDMKPTSRPY